MLDSANVLAPAQSADWETNRASELFNVYGRLKSSLTIEQAEADSNKVAATLAQLYPKENSDSKILGEFLLRVQNWSPLICAILFAVGSTIFSWLLLRGRIIPIPLAWIGVFASVILVIGLPLRLAGFFADPIFMVIWLPMLVFEVPLGVCLMVKGGRWPSPA